MSRHIASSYFYDLPSGNRVHPCRLIHKDGTIMWKHALLYQNELLCLPQSHAHEAHIIKTAQRVEELNTWVSQSLDPWEFLKPVYWYYPSITDLSEGIAVYLKHTSLPSSLIFEPLKEHLHEFETLTEREGYLYFRRC